MCGIAGLIDANRSEMELRRAAQSMADTLIHRGPDGSGLWVDGEAKVAFGHRRLAIIDPSPLGAQPMASPSGRYQIVHNGEIYNFIELRSELEAKGFSFRGGSDTEVMLAAFEAWGVAASLERFIGMFAFAVWDKERRDLSLARDRLGIKPLFWGTQRKMFLFGSELKALTACPGWSPEIDRNALAAYMRWNYVPSPHSIYQGVRKLEPGTLLVVRAGEPARLTRYWDMRRVARAGLAEPHDMMDAEATDRLEKLLLDSVTRHMRADVPLGVFLSGGIDSSVVAALMRARSARPVRTFSIGFHERDYDEAPHAKAVAAHLGTDHTELYVAPSDCLAVIPHLARYYDEPFADSSQVPTLLLSQMTHRHVTVALSGDGGDELFAGYTRYHWAEMIHRRFGRLPLSVRTSAASAIAAVPGRFWEVGARLLPERRRPARVASRALTFASLLSADGADAIYRRQHTHWTDPATVVPGGREVHGLPFDPTVAVEIPGFIERMQFLDSVTYLPDDILTKVDRASMAVSLEVRVPLLDHQIVEFVWGLPLSMKVRRGRDKWLLRQVLSRYVPRNLVERPKMGFSVPIGQWLRGPLRDWAEALLEERRLVRDGMFAPLPIRQAWEAYLNGTSLGHEAIWGVLMFQAWYEGQAQMVRAH